MQDPPHLLFSDRLYSEEELSQSSNCFCLSRNAEMLAPVHRLSRRKVNKNKEEEGVGACGTPIVIHRIL